MHSRQALCALVFIAVSGPAFADVYSYTDAGGVAHFSNVPADSRYQLLIASDEPSTPATEKAPNVNWLARSAQYEQMIRGAAQAVTLQPALVSAVIVVESGFNPRAVSKKGAIGLMQLRPETARRYGVTNLYDPEQNVRAGTHYLRDLMTRFGSNLELALAAYNAGEDAVEHYGRHIPPYPETLSYVPSVMRVYQKLRAQARAT